MLRIGTSGFSFPDWKGTVYPERISGKEMLSYYARKLGFDCVEINATYYRLPTARTMEEMLRKVPKDFEFVVKGFRGITHDPFDSRLEKIPGTEEVDTYLAQFKEAMKPLQADKKLGAVLLQFPVFFSSRPETHDYILKCKERLKEMELVIEFRNSGWAQDETFAFLRENGLGYCAVDEPKLPRLMPFRNEVTSSIGYLRFHGRNRNWFNAPVSERYDYLYSNTELGEFTPEIRKMEKKAKKVFAFFNNCHLGSAAKNALTLKALLGLEGPAAERDFFT